MHEMTRWRLLSWEDVHRDGYGASLFSTHAAQIFCSPDIATLITAHQRAPSFSDLCILLACGFREEAFAAAVVLHRLACLGRVDVNCNQQLRRYLSESFQWQNSTSLSR